MTTTHTGTRDCQVLVAGAGPTGLTLAAQLLARGIHARVIDKGDGPASQSRALGIHARTLEWTTPSFLETVTSGKVGAHDITEAAPR